MHQWTTKDGTKIPVDKLDDDHLLNIHRWLKKNQLIYLEMLDCSIHPVFAPRGEMAQLAFEQELDHAEAEFSRSAKWEVIMLKEIEKRGLTPLPAPEKRKLPEFELVEDLGGPTIWKKKEE